MLRGINPLLSPDLLHCLCAMGHGDEIVIGDANFPAESLGPRCIRLDGISATDVLEAIIGVLPLDQFDPQPAHTMQVVGDPAAAPEITAVFQQIIDQHADHPAQIATLERFEFYDRARKAFGIIQTGEARLYGNIILKKGVIAQ